jgi:putative transposase
LNIKKRGLEIIHDKVSDKYFLHYPVDRDWFPEDDRRNDKQGTLFTSDDRIISLDPGIRKFLVGYDPRGNSIFIGEGAQNRLINLLLEIDKTKGDTFLLWKKIKNLVNELHWKAINFLIKNYDTIILPEFPVSKMIRGKKLGKMTKRLMLMFSFHSFKQKLKWKAGIYGKKVIIVDESYTSRTCGLCGHLVNIKANETFNCNSCGMQTDRDINGSRNIFIKNITLR